MILPTLPQPGEPFVLRDVRVPATFAQAAGGDGVVRLDIGIADGRIAFVEAADAATPAPWREVHIDRAMVWPCLVEAHAHLDSAHIWPRSPNPDGSFAAAGRTIVADRERHWTPEDMHRRMAFGLRSAYAHGVRAMRTHLASQNDQIELRWEIFADLRAAWADRIALQAVPLISTEALADERMLARVVEVVRRHGGVLGAYAPPSPMLDAMLARLFEIAARHGWSLDFHADETGDPSSDVLRRLARLALAHPGPVLVGHCCSLAMQEEAEAELTLDLVAEAGLGIVSLPGCNLYLQGRRPGRTPRWRGVTLIHEMAARGIPVCIGSDNCRDPYHPYGDFDPLESFRDAVRIAQLDNPVGDWPRSVTTVPGELVATAQSIATGQPADLIVFRAASLNELLARPATRRLQIRRGHFVEAELPDYGELDP